MTPFGQKILVDYDRHEFAMSQVSLSAVFSVVTQRSSMGGPERLTLAWYQAPYWGKNEKKKSANEVSREVVWGGAKGSVGLFPHCGTSSEAMMTVNARKRCCCHCKI